jgi:hypothetical protein
LMRAAYSRSPEPSSGHAVGFDRAQPKQQAISVEMAARATGIALADRKASKRIARDGGRIGRVPSRDTGL